MQLYSRYDGGILTQFKYFDNFFTKTNYDVIFDWLNTLKYIPGERFNGSKIDRDQIWFQDDGRYFCEVWKTRKDRWEAYNYDSFLENIQTQVNEKNNLDTNSCLINKYKDGNDIIPPHKDNSYSFGEYPTVVIYSVGSERTMRIKSDIDNSTIDFNLKPNSLFIMSGGSQKYFTHEIIKNDCKNTRYSLTFRKHICYK